MTDQTQAFEKINQIIKDIKVAMLTTEDVDGSFHSRPMMTQNRDFDGDLWFFATRTSDKVYEIGNNSSVNVTYADDNSYISIAGQAEIITEVAKKKELWHEPLRIWFENGPEAPDVVLIRVNAQSAQYWDGPSGILGKAVSAVKVLLTGDKDAAGESEKVTF